MVQLVQKIYYIKAVSLVIRLRYSAIQKKNCLLVMPFGDCGRDIFAFYFPSKLFKKLHILVEKMLNTCVFWSYFKGN